MSLALEADALAAPALIDPATDDAAFQRVWHDLALRLARLPPKPARDTGEAAHAAALLEAGRAARVRFLAVHAPRIYDALTMRRTRFLRLDDLVYAAAEHIPGLTPTRAQVAAEAGLFQRDKDGVEIDQGLFLSAVLADPACGEHLCHAMLLPRPESAAHLARFAAQGVLDLGPARLERRGPAVRLTAGNPRFLNAEDDATLTEMEIAVDVATLDPLSSIAVVRGGMVEGGKYDGRRMLGAGINLTHLYQGKIPFLWFLIRDLGFVHKMLRGVASIDSFPDDVRGAAREKPWIAAVDTFAIGGHCQMLLCMDYVIAASDAFMTLPARKEGIVPGFANLRLPRFVGDRIARQAIQYERRLPCDSPEGRMICDRITTPADMDAAIDETVDGLTSAGAVSAVSNRRCFRVAQEPFDLFRRYAAVYAREQAFCHFSPALIANLERNWDAKNRRG